MNPFKPGNWVRHIAFKSKHKCISINDGEFDDKVSVTNSPSFDNEFMIDYELWHPKVGEWCWFWNVTDFDAPTLSRFCGMQDKLFRCTNSKQNLFTHCEPFIGQLPTSIKDLS